MLLVLTHRLKPNLRSPAVRPTSIPPARADERFQPNHRVALLRIFWANP